MAPADMVRELKKASSVWAAEHHEPDFAWQEGYSIFTTSWTHALAVRQYIAGQEEHHRRLSFREELERLLKRNGVKFEARFLE